MKGASIAEHFSQLEDPRVERTRRHDLLSIIAIALCAVICGADNWVAVARYGRYKEEWLRSWLPLDGGIPSHDTFGRVFAMLDPKEFRRCLASWMEAVQEATGNQVCIDGKTIRGSRDSALGKKAIHMVRAWAAENRLVLGQVKVDEKSNEVKAIPELLELLDLKGCLVTIDAEGCQTKIAEEIVAKEADYVLAVKGNQEQLQDDLEDFFSVAESEGYRDVPHSYAHIKEKEHGRIETRECWATDDPSCLACLDRRERWPGLRSIAMVRRRRRKTGEDATKESVETVFYISTLEADANKILEATRRHWSIENSLHWILDVAFDEDNCRVRTRNAAENLSTLRCFALGLIKQDTTVKAGVKIKRQSAGWSNDYLLHFICQ